MACEGFGGGHWRYFVAEEATDCGTLADVVVAGSGAVSVDVVHLLGLYAGVGESFLHSQIGALAIGGGRGLMEGVASVAVTGQVCQWLGATTTCMVVRLYHEPRCTFAKVEACAAFVEGAAGLFVENHQGCEAVEVELGDALATTDNHAFGETCTDELCAGDDGIGCRRAGGGKGGEHAKAAEVVGNHLGAGTAVMCAYVLVAAVVLEEVHVVQLALVHAAHCGAGDERYLRQHIGSDGRLLQSLFEGQHAHKGRACGGLCGRVNAEEGAHLVVGELHLAHGELMVVGLEIMQRAYAATLCLQ